MSKLLSSIGVRNSILILVVLPLIVLTGLGGILAWTNWRGATEMRSIARLAGLAPAISAVIHELQKERGSSALFIGSKGADQARDRLAVQRTATDGRVQDLQAAVETFDVAVYGDGYAQQVAQAIAAFTQLKGQRAKVDALGLTPPQMAKYYTATINQLLNLITPMSAISTDTHVSSTINGYVAILRAKEFAGLERAMGAAGFGAKEFNPLLHRRLVELIGRQDALVSVFEGSADQEAKSFFSEQMNKPAVTEVVRLRKIAVESPFTQDLQGVSGGQWFDATTKRIDLLKAVEDRLAADLVALAELTRADAQERFLTLSALLAALVIGFGLIGMTIARNISGPIGDIVSAVEGYRAGDKLEMPGADRNDGLGALARSLNVIADTGLEAARLKAALDSCQTNVMVADVDRNIVYLNNNLQEMLSEAEDDLRKDLPHFSASSLMGGCIDQFHREPEPIRRLLESLTTTHEAQIVVGGRTLALTISPVRNGAGDQLGYVVEWRDRTAELKAVGEVDHMIAAANAGDLGVRLSLDDKEGSLRTMAEGLNLLATSIDDVTNDLGKMLASLSLGDLTRKIDANYEGRYGELKNSANETVDRLAETLANIKFSSGEVQTASGEIASASEDLARRTEQAAASLEETSASTETLSVTVQQNADNARKASDLAASANSSATKGGEVVERAVTAMSGIDASAKRITEIIAVIDEIAFQTNLLALNASVEAARAGDAGKGFAVVAQEVRGLAQRSAEAAGDIKNLIQDSNAQVEEGVELVNTAGSSLAEIVESIGKVAEIVREIADASHEQTVGVSDINGSVSNMDAMTQQNAAMVEETTAAARALSDQADALAEQIESFKLADAAASPQTFEAA